MLRRYAPPPATSRSLTRCLAIQHCFFYHCLPLLPPIVHRRHALAITISRPAQKALAGIIDCAVRLLRLTGRTRGSIDGQFRETATTSGDRSRINVAPRRIAIPRRCTYDPSSLPFWQRSSANLLTTTITATTTKRGFDPPNFK